MTRGGKLLSFPQLEPEASAQNDNASAVELGSEDKRVGRGSTGCLSREKRVVEAATGGMKYSESRVAARIRVGWPDSVRTGNPLEHGGGATDEECNRLIGLLARAPSTLHVPEKHD